MPIPFENKCSADKFYSLDIKEPCELIDGKIYDMSPSPSIKHQKLVSGLHYEIRHYIKKQGGKCEAFMAPTDVKLNDENIVIPDIFVACDPNRFDEQKYNGAPDWVIEVTSPSNYQRDLKDKLIIYKEAGVREYWIVDPLDGRVIVYLFGKPNITEFYTFDDVIETCIFKNKSEPLTIRVNDVL